MTVIEALFLGLIQGITEFLPISSSAHLIIFRHFMKIEDTQTVFFNVLLHFGSMIAILLTFSKEWKRLFLALCGIIIDLFHNLKEHFSSQHQEGKQYRKVLGSNYRMLAFLLILTTIPTAVIGGMIQSLVTLTSSNLLAPGVGLYLTAILLVVADMLPEGEKTQKNLKPKDALIAGFFQGFSTIPGLSRLGSTISACVIGGMTRSYAVKYSLIVSVPAIIGATIVEIATMGKKYFSSQHQEGKQYRKVLGSNYRMLAFLLILTTIPTAVIGGMIQSLVTLTSSNLLAPGVGLYLTAILLVVADMLPEGEKTQKNLKPKDALIAGFFQGFSTIPGLSRLGSTISACVIGGMTRSYAVKYSLIVSVPAIIGATIVEIATMGKNKIVFHPVYLVGVFMAALAGYFTIRILMRVVKKRKLKYFALYCLLVGTFSIAGYFLL